MRVIWFAAACCISACSGEKSEGLPSDDAGGLDASSELDGGAGGGGDGGSSGEDGGDVNDAASSDAGSDAGLPQGDFERVAHVYAGGSHACALMVDGRVKCWGANGDGELGRGDNITLGDDEGELGTRLQVVPLGAASVAELSLGNDFSCARFNDGSVKCWGGNENGQLGQDGVDSIGDEDGEVASLAAINLGLGRTAVDIDAGSRFACALLDDGSVKCWGANESGQLGQGDTTNRGDKAGDMAALDAVDLGVGRTAKQMTLGYKHVCVVRDDESLVCWGHNSYGQMGRGATMPPLDLIGDEAGEMGGALVPLSLGTGRTIQRMDSGNTHTCALLDDGNLKCWGSNPAGVLGVGDEDNRGDDPGELGDALQRVSFAVGRTVKDFAIGEGHGCAWLDDDLVTCWGNNGSGELGVGDDLSRGATPGVIDDAVLLGTGSKLAELALGEGFTCARFENERVKCWGDAASGVPGVGSNEPEIGDEASDLGDALPYLDLGKP